MILATVLLLAGLQATSSSQVTAQWDAAGQIQTYPDPTGPRTFTFTATGIGIGVVKVLADGSLEPSPSYSVAGSITSTPPTMMAPLRVADAAFLLTGRPGVAPDPTQRFKVVVFWVGWRTRSDDPASRVEVYSPVGVSAETLTLSVTSLAPMDGTFTILGGTGPRAPTAPGTITFRQ